MTDTVCGFCKGKPVGNAATWIDGKPRPPAPCPRCGETNWPMDVPTVTHETPGFVCTCGSVGAGTACTCRPVRTAVRP